MKKTDLYKNEHLKVLSLMKSEAARAHPGVSPPAAPNRREQRKMDQARGLVPFAVKLEAGLAARLRERAMQQGCDLNVLVGGLLERALATAPDTVPPTTQS